MRFKYDKDVDIFTISKPTKVKHSMEVGDFIVDFDRNDLVVGIEILEASEHLGRLKSVQDASMSVSYKPNSIYVTISLFTDGKEKDITIPLARQVVTA